MDPEIAQKQCSGEDAKAQIKSGQGDTLGHSEETAEAGHEVIAQKDRQHADLPPASHQHQDVGDQDAAHYAQYKMQHLQRDAYLQHLTRFHIAQATDLHFKEDKIRVMGRNRG